jgi:hypothetical protein
MFLSSGGATVQVLPTSTRQECDLLAELNGVRLLVEEKTKLDSPDVVYERREAYSRGETHSFAQSVSYNNRISGIIRKAKEQLSSTGEGVSHDLRILWFTGVGVDAEAQQSKLISTLYGSTNVFDIQDSNGMATICYFFRNSDFYRYRNELDGAVAARLSLDERQVDIRFCLNPHSSNYEALRDSGFASRCSDGLMDPIAEERTGEAYIVDGSVDRSDEIRVLGYLERKYGLFQAAKIDMSLFLATARIPEM